MYKNVEPFRRVIPRNIQYLASRRLIFLYPLTDQKPVLLCERVLGASVIVTQCLQFPVFRRSGSADVLDAQRDRSAGATVVDLIMINVEVVDILRRPTVRRPTPPLKPKCTIWLVMSVPAGRAADPHHTTRQWIEGALLREPMQCRQDLRTRDHFLYLSILSTSALTRNFRSRAHGSISSMICLTIGTKSGRSTSSNTNSSWTLKIV